MTNLKKLVAKCIRCWPELAWDACGGRGRSLIAALALLPFVALAQSVTVLGNSSETIDVSAASLMWTDTSGQSTIGQITSRPGYTFVPSRAETVYTLGHKATLWQHYRFARQDNAPEDWILEFPQPLLDRITVYQSTAAGSWTSQTAGDTVPVSRWPEPGRYAQFKLSLAGTGAHDVYVQIHNVANISVPVRVSTQSMQIQRIQLEYLLVGVVFGTLLLLVATCLTQSWIYRDPTYAWYAVYASVLTLTMATWTGVAGHLLWSNAGAWNDISPGFMGVLTGSAALVFINHLCGSPPRQKWFERFLYAMGFAGLPISVIYVLTDRTSGVLMISAYLVTVALLGIAKSTSTWLRRDMIGMWVFVAFGPTAAATGLLVASVMGFVPSSWLSRYGLMIGMIVEVPLLLIALNLRSRERHSVEARAQAMVSQDALTGLLTAHLFNDRLVQVIARAKRYKEPAAVVYIKLVNYSYIKKTWGVAVAEQSLLRSVIKLRRILRDVDTVGRVDEAMFGLILEGASERSAVTALSARLIAAGLMPLKGLKPEVVLQFHVAAVLLGERYGAAIEINESLTELIRRMGARTRRPIRFLEPELTRPMELGTESEFEPEQTDNGRRSAQRA